MNAASSRKRLAAAATAAAIAGAAVMAPAAALGQTVIRIDAANPVGRINPEVYGQFVEHLGAGVYGGLWVGEESEIANTDGIRDDVFAALERLDVPVMRWPGGCFADYYRWRDGVGPREKRPARINVNWGGAREPNHFGTHEFFNLAERLGAKTYLNLNLGTGAPGEAKDWLEYITSSADAALANERRANGREEPWKVDYLTVGNETWGCGGNLRPAAYADFYAQYMTFAKAENGDPVRIVSGSHDANIEYSDEVLVHPAMDELAQGISVHFYTLPTSDWADKGDATGFAEDEWASAIERTLRMDGIIAAQIAMIDSHELGDGFGLYIDEWGMWTNQEEGAPEGSLYQQNTIRDAVVAALNFNIFHAHADRVPMTNIAQMVNVLQAMILTDGPDMLLTPTYHVYEMYKPFQGATAYPVALKGPKYRHGRVSFPALSASAARNGEGEWLVALVNADPSRTHPVTLPALAGMTVEGRVLTGAAIDAHNTFKEPGAVTPKPAAVAAAEGGVRLDLPPRSVTVLRATSGD